MKSSWKQRHAAMTPLFANTMATQSVMEEDESYSGEIRATQDVQQFTATQDGIICWNFPNNHCFYSIKSANMPTDEIFCKFRFVIIVLDFVAFVVLF